MSVRDWTPEQVRNAVLYMTCHVCGAPREVEVRQWYDDEATHEDDGLRVEMSIVCPNGHPQR